MATSDGWHTVVNRTPLGVPTDGGAIVSADATNVDVGVLPFRLLKVSPLLTSSTGGVRWEASQLPAGLNDSPHAVARRDQTTFAVLANGVVVVSQGSSGKWSTLTVAKTLDPSGGFLPSGIASPDGKALVIFGTSKSAETAAYVSNNGGLSWQALRLPTAAAGAVTSLSPCRSSTGWLIPLLTSKGVVVNRAARVGGPWTSAPAPIPVINPVTVCGAGRVWLSVTRDSQSNLWTLDQSGPWRNTGSVAARIISIAPISASRAFAATADQTVIATLTISTSSTSSSLTLGKVKLPSWVSTVGGAKMTN
jgi:hypothetical protein